MSFSALRATIEGVMYTNWTTTPVAYENVPFDNVPDGPWVRVQINMAEGVTAGIAGNGVNVAVWDKGVLSLQIFVKENTGTDEAQAMADTLIALYEHTRFGAIVFYTASVRSAGISEGRHQTNITIPFRRIRNV